MRNKPGLLLLVFWLIFCVLAAGCSAAAPSPTPVPPSPTPLPSTPSTAPTALPLPTDPGPNSRVPAIKNFSLVSGKVVGVAPDASNPAVVRVTVSVVSTSQVEGFPSFTDDKVGKEIEILLDSSLASTVAAGDSVQVKVSYRGDESGGSFYGSEMTILPK